MSAGATPASSELALKGGKKAAICSVGCIVTFVGRNELASAWSSPRARTRPPAFTHAPMAGVWAASSRPPPGPDHQHLVRRRRLAFEWRGFDPAGRQPGQAGGFAGVHRGAPGGWLPGLDIPQDVARQCLGRRVALGSPSHVHLAEKDQPAALAVFKKRAILEGVAAVNNWKEVTPGRLFNQHRGYVAPVAAAPQPGEPPVRTSAPSAPR